MLVIIHAAKEECPVCGTELEKGVCPDCLWPTNGKTRQKTIKG